MTGNDRFARPVRIRIKPGLTQEVGDVFAAQEILLLWPGTHGPKYEAAVVAILEGGARDVDAMERALRAAAKEAGILARE